VSVASAYRRDVAAGRTRENESEGAWIAVASLIEQAAEAERATQKDLVDAAAHLAVKTLRSPIVRAEARAEWGRPADGDGEILFLFTAAVLAAGLFDLAESVAAAALRLSVFSALDHGRFAILRARIARRLDRPDFAEDSYRSVLNTAKKLGSPELRARASLGLGSLAQVAGNYPEFLRWSRATIASAHEARTPRMEHEGYMGIVVVMAMRKDFGRAIEAAWAMIERSKFDRAQEAKDLATLGRLLVEMGRFNSAVKVLTRLFTRPAPPNAFVAALGSLSIAAARTGDATLLDWTLVQVDGLKMAAVPRWEYASTLLDVATALLAAGRGAVAKKYRDAAVKLAAKYEFHEIVIRTDALETDTEPLERRASPVGPGGAKVLRSIDRWSATRLPRRARMAGPLSTR
jgi:tetratricopeptide (TPR) repeat protein